MEKDNEVKGEGNWLQFGDFGYDPRTGRRNNIDPVTRPSMSQYLTFGNNPILNADPSGYDWFGSEDGKTAIHRNSSDATYKTEDGSELKNIGTTYKSSSTVGNTTVNNYYNQDELIHTETIDNTPSYGFISNHNTDITFGLSSLTYNSYQRVNLYLKPLAELKAEYEAGKMSAQGASIARYYFLKNTRENLDFFGQKFSNFLKSDLSGKAQAEKFLSKASPTAEEVAKVFNGRGWVNTGSKFLNKAGPVLIIATESYNAAVIIKNKPSFEQVQDMYDSPISNPIFSVYKRLIERPLYNAFGLYDDPRTDKVETWKDYEH